MRITKESLLNTARDTAEKHARRNRDLSCIYLTGSLLSDSPLLGGTTDIDLIFVHSSTPPYTREVVHVSDEVHLDIAHYSQAIYRQPRRLRTDAWVGSHLVLNALALYDAQHWFEFTQASAGAQFTEPENVITRARSLSTAARQSWTDMHMQRPDDPAQLLLLYLEALENAANSIAVVTGTPLAERRFILEFPERAQAVNHIGLSGGLLDLFAPENLSSSDLSSLMEDWKATLTTVSQLEKAPARLSTPRLLYYERAAAALNEENTPAALWLVLRTWTRAILALDEIDKPFKHWQNACHMAELDTEHIDQRLEMLDAYLDAVEETLDGWAEKYGV